MKRTKKLTPEVHAKAEGFIANGYQRLLTFEVPGGGFSWFGQRARQQDPHRLRPDGVLRHVEGPRRGPEADRAHAAVAGRAAAGRRKLEAGHQLHQRRRHQPLQLRRAAHHRLHRLVAREHRLSGAGGREGPAVRRAAHGRARSDAYTLAVLANFAADYGKDREFTRQAMQTAARRAHREGRAGLVDRRRNQRLRHAAPAPASRPPAWPCRRCSSGAGLRARRRKALSYIASKKDASGTWGTTQATIMALRALLLSTEKGAADVRGTRRDLAQRQARREARP